jgi:hypothetical protein
MMTVQNYCKWPISPVAPLPQGKKPTVAKGWKFWWVLKVSLNVTARTRISVSTVTFCIGHVPITIYVQQNHHQTTPIYIFKNDTLTCFKYNAFIMEFPDIIVS